MGAGRERAWRTSGDLNCLFPSLTPRVLSPCPPDPASVQGWWVIQSPVSEVTPCRRAEGAQDKTLGFNLPLPLSFSFSTTMTADCCLVFVNSSLLKWSKHCDLSSYFFWPSSGSVEMEVRKKKTTFSVGFSDSTLCVGRNATSSHLSVCSSLWALYCHS